MSAKNMDRQGRWRNKVVAFRVSPEEDAMIEAKVQMSGMNKQDYIIARLADSGVIVNGNPRVFKALKHHMEAILEELKRLSSGESVSEDLIELTAFAAEIMKGMKDGE
ncbi:MAG: hypothetical protein Q4B26_17310 [Eubacteriales bacterium]|nr:hypothetical protein [Eubacteriales bacterium]